MTRHPGLREIADKLVHRDPGAEFNDGLLRFLIQRFAYDRNVHVSADHQAKRRAAYPYWRSDGGRQPVEAEDLGSDKEMPGAAGAITRKSALRALVAIPTGRSD